MKKISELFIIEKGKSYFKDFEVNPKSDISYITTSGSLQGVKTKVNPNENHKLYKKETITVALQGTVLSSFVQIDDFYLQTHVAALIPKEKLSLKEKIYYCLYINQYKDMYSYGRKANSTLQNLLVPEKHEIPSWVYETEIPDYSDMAEPKENKLVELPDSSKWKEFSFNELFEIGKAKGPKAKEAENNIGIHPYITATAENNGIKCYTSIEPQHKGNCLTIGHLGDPFYQEKDFSGNNVTYLYSKTKALNQYIGLFLVSLLEFLPKKYNYGNVVGIAKMKNEKISLPVDSNGNPDWQLMEDYIKSLPYSKYLD